MKSPSHERKQKSQPNNNLPLTSPYLSGPIRPCRALSRDGARGRTRSNPPPNNRRSRSKSPALVDHRRKYSNGYDDYSVNSVGSKGYGTASSRRNLSRTSSNGNIDDSKRTILLPTEVDETLREMGKFPIQVHLPFEFYKIHNKENKHANLPIDDSDDDSSLESKYADDLNDIHVFPLGSYPTKKQRHNNLEIERDFVKFPPVVKPDGNSNASNDVDSMAYDMKDKLIQRKKKRKKNRKLLKSELTDMVDTIPKMRTGSASRKHASNADSKKMMNSLLQPLSGSLSAKSSRTKTWI